MALDLITLRDPRAAAAEAYRTLRTNIQFSSIERKLHTILVTSSVPDEDKSVALANLAVTFAQAEQRVIVLDCDLRRPSLHSLFGVSNDRGLSQAMSQNSDLPLLKTEIDGLQLLPAGATPPSPADLLSSKRFDSMLRDLKQQADIVLIDAPPVLAASDAALLATKVDGVVLVTRAGKTRRDSAREAVALLQRVNAHLVGVVLTNAKLERERYARY
ncbi:CpsD/CapB family tyrosine-protein kinase [Herpetosiphon geysericola]|uniref:Capsular biosynthesis protein n=1 Tax=Herpetosiphon geysericola TaxID=70996 RepID=A0A0P6Y8L0_9CHLR|nr:CpsD/CapB family tyrosine-protein kinase [Herpetosiphon geysericola]KPL85355.1 capsular biosynthesis protein [Herpetosiphon geysericola]